MNIFILIATFILLSSCSFPQNRWTKLNGPEGAVIAGLYAKGDTLLAGTGFSRGLIFYSTNRGEQWHQADISVINRVRDFTDTADSGFIAVNYPNALYKSFDLKTWTKLQPSAKFWSVGRDQNDYIFAGRDDGRINFSADNGLTWVVTEPAPHFRIENFTTSQNYLFAGSYQRILRKSKDSLAWSLIGLNTLNSLKLFIADSIIVYAHTNHEIFLSTDEGETWIKQNTGTFFNYEIMVKSIYNTRLLGAFSNMVGILQGKGWGAAVSDDQGITWRWSQTGLPPFVGGTSLAKSGTETYLGTNAAGVFKSTDFGDSWFPVNKGLNAATVTDIHFDNDGILYAASWSNGLSRSKDMGENWEMINNGVTNVNFYSIISDGTGILLAGSDRGTFRSSDKGENWIRISAPGNDYVYNLWKDKFNRIYALTYGSGFYRTTDLGDSWTRMDKNFNSGYIFGLAMDKAENLYAGGRGGGAIYKSTDDGNSWTKIYQGISNAVISEIVVTLDNHIFATSINEGILRSTDQGLSWELRNSGLPSLKFQSLTNGFNGQLFLGLGVGGVYSSTNDGENWHNTSDNLGQAVVYDFIFHEKDIYLATDESVWKSNPDSLTSVTEDDVKPKEYFLSQNYPNPFNPSTTIKYSLAEAGRVTLSIYDLLGREIMKLLDEEKPAGEYETNWNASSYTSGVYFMRMQAGEFSETRKAVLMK
jgi:photosystem II stability/assembly factor-like uncharacterized protein